MPPLWPLAAHTSRLTAPVIIISDASFGVLCCQIWDFWAIGRSRSWEELFGRLGLAHLLLGGDDTGGGLRSTECRLVMNDSFFGWLRASVVERWSSAGELSLSCARPVADGWPLTWVTVRYRSTNQANSAFHPFGVDRWVESCSWISSTWLRGGAIWWTLTKERQAWCICT